MPGRGPAPKPSHQRARTNRDLVPTTVLEFRPAGQPTLPSRRPGGKAWPAQTKRWWEMWGRSAIAETFTETDWNELLDTAVLHARYWGDGDVRVEAGLRLRVAKFGATPEDRARLRIQF